jgi:hypothetical protein
MEVVFMRPVKTLLVAGVASLVLAGAAIAAKEKMHVMSVQLPDGSVQQIPYSGDVAPKIVMVPAAAVSPAAFFESAFGPNSPFAMMDRISAQMNAQAEAMMREASTLATQGANGRAVTPTVITNMPAGSFHYSMVSTTSGSNGCTETVQISSTGQGQQPKVINTSSGDCSQIAKPGLRSATLPNAVAAPAPSVVKPVAYDPKADTKPKAATPVI